MSFEKHLESFTAYMEYRTFSPRTIEAYTRHSKEFVTFLESYYPRVTRPNKVTRDIVDDYQRYVRELTTTAGRPLANATVRLKLTAVRRFFGHLIQRDVVLKDPTTVIVPPKEEQRLTRTVLTQQETLDLLNSIEPRDPASMRDRAILELFYACGIRTTELCDLKVSEGDLKEQTVMIVNGKGGKSRIVPIGQYATHYIRLYLEKGRPRLLMGRRTDPGNLFLSSRGTPFTRETINRSVMGRANKLLGGRKRISCYSLRHGVASHLIANGVDIFYVAKLLGHESLETTKRYLKMEISDLKRVHAKYHPREREHSLGGLSRCRINTPVISGGRRPSAAGVCSAGITHAATMPRR